jgi:hypothetical protein
VVLCLEDFLVIVVVVINVVDGLVVKGLGQEDDFFPEIVLDPEVVLQDVGTVKKGCVLIY